MNVNEHIGHPALPLTCRPRSPYSPPRILSFVPLTLEECMLSASVVECIEYVEMTGHEVESYDFSEPQFNHTWE